MINNPQRQRPERPLFIFACGFTLSCFCCALFFSKIADLPFGMSIVAGAVCAFTLSLPRQKAMLMVPILGYGLGLAFFMLMQQTAYLPTQKFAGEIGEVEFMVLEEPVLRHKYSSVIAEITQVGDEKTRFKAQIYLDDATPNDILAGDCFRGEFGLKATAHQAERRYIQDEIFIYAKQNGKIERLETKRNTARFVPQKIAGLAIKSYDETLPKEQAALMRAIVIGDKTGISQQQKRNIMGSGTSHITAVSGLHVSLLLALIIAIFGYSAGSIIAVPMIAMYVLVVGAPPSAVRAAAMIFFSIGALKIARKKDALTAIGGAILLLILISPWCLLDIGLQLSFASVLGLTVFFPHMHPIVYKIFTKHRILNKAIDFLLSSFISTASVLIFTLPILCLYFSRISVLMFLGNLLILPIVAVVIACGVIIPVLFYGASALVAPFAFIGKIVLIYVGSVQSVIANTKHSSIPAKNIYLIIFALAVLLLGIIFISQKRGGKTICAIVAAVGVSCTAFAIAENRIFVDVSLVNVSGNVALLARNYDSVSAFGSGEFLADEYYETVQRKMDAWCIDDIESFVQLNYKSTPPIDTRGNVWLKVEKMMAPAGFENNSYISKTMLEFSTDGAMKYPWGTAKWYAAGDGYAGLIHFNGGKFLLGCGIKPAEMLDCVQNNELKADYFVINEKYSADMKRLREICEVTEITELICMEKMFGGDISFAKAFDGKINYVKEYESRDFKMMAHEVIK